MGAAHAKQAKQTQNLGCSNCRSVYIPGVNDNCKACKALFVKLIHEPLKAQFGKRYNMKFIRNHVIVYHNDNYNARLATKIILDHLHFREFKRDTCVRHGDYVIKLLKPSASLLLPDDDLEDQLHWFGVSFKITPWVGIMGN